MNFNVITVKNFDKQAKRLVKKYPSLKKEITSLFESLEQNPLQGEIYR